MKNRLIGVAAAAMLALSLAGCGTETACSQDFYAMDTAMSITAYGADAQAAINESISYINTLEADISRTRETSDIYAVNHAEGETVTVSEQTADVLRRALELAEETEGCFDPTIAPLSDLWGIGTENAAVPAQEEIDAVLPLVDYTRVKLDGTEVTVPADMQIDLGGIGKGYAADHVAQILRDAGIEHATISLGGNVYAVGSKDKGLPWSVGITDPDEPGSWFAALKVSDTSIVTSGDYERYFEQDGKRYCHIFDPETGYPAETDLRSVTIVSADSTKADACTTALFVMGLDRAVEYCKAHDIEAVFVCRDHTVHVTDGLKDSFSMDSAEYTYEK
ncbi:MAG: FAD:protein FMN transferase [Eubacteriales bacterium]|nr:FAD:protein FMN transferase [Eubacteriales bacterium]